MFQQFGFIEILVIAGFAILLLGFIVLFRLAGVLKKAGAANKIAPVQNNDKPQTTAKNTATVQSVATVKQTDATLIAVLAAAVAAYMGTSPNNLEIRSYRRLKSEKPSWSKAGRNDIMNNHI